MDSVLVSRNKGDEALVMKESMDFIENFNGEEFISTSEESKSVMVIFNILTNLDAGVAI
jgi:hypothetical protein